MKKKAFAIALLIGSIAAAEPSGYKHYFSFPDNEDPFYVEASMLYWLPSASDMAFALTKTDPIPGTSETPFDPESASTYGAGQLHSSKFDWNYGVRGLLGYSFNYTPWSIAVDYTYFDTNKSSSIYAPEGPYAYLTAFNQYESTLSNVTIANYTTKLNYQTGRVFALGASFHPVPEVGINLQASPKITYVKRDWMTKFTGEPTVPTYQITTNQSNWHYFGSGLNFTFTSDFNFGAGFGADLLVGISGLYGKMHGKFTSCSFRPSTGNNLENLNITQSENRMLWESQMRASLTLSRKFSKAAIRLAVGYEFNQLQNIGNQILRGALDPDDLNSASLVNYENEPLFIQGIVASFGLAF